MADVRPLDGRSNYVEAFRIANLTTFLVNSFVIAISVMLLVVFIASLGAYALSRFHLRGRNVFMMLALMPQFFPYVFILIPFSVLMSNIGLVDSHFGLILTPHVNHSPLRAVDAHGLF